MRFALAAAVALGLVFASHSAMAEEPAWRTASSLLGDVKYPPDFKHFDYVNPDAPKGGAVRMSAAGSFDSLNLVPVRGVPAAGLSYLYQTLMTPSQDEASTEYPELAEAVRYPADYAWVAYRLNPAARWNDGTPVTADDVVWSFEALKANNPQQAFYYQDVVKAEKTSEREVTFTFDKPGNRELPQIVGQLLVLPKHWWTGAGPGGKPRDISAGTLEPPLGSGPYRVKDFAAGRSITYERVKDWWGSVLPSAVGHNNFDEIRFEYFLDRDVMREGFKADSYDFRVESVSKDWMTAYDVPQVKDGRIVREEFPDTASGRMQAFGFNLRRAKFQDARVRRAFNLAFDFEEMNKALFFGLYKRTASYFDGIDLASSGLPEGQELEILQGVKDKVPASVFTTPYANPVGGTDEARRANLRAAVALLKEAGFEIKDKKLVDTKTGEAMNVEFLLDNAAFERVVLAYKPALERLGIAVSLRTVDPAQYEDRERNRDFDIIIFSQGQSKSPGNEQRAYWGSKSADQPGSPNTLGIKDAAIDILIDRVVFAKDRAELVAATKALDRVLLAGDYVVPQWRSPTIRTLRWDRFAHPAVLPNQSLTGGFPDVWWYDPERAAKTGAKK